VESGRGGLSGVDASQGSLIFEGPVQCLAQPRAGDWRLRGRLRSANAGKHAPPVELLLSGVRCAAPALPLPPRLHELRVQAGVVLELSAREGSFILEVEALRVHHDVSRSFYRALPRISLSLLTRAGWATLLTLLRLPFISRLLKKPA
jgi:hypothetical protein